MAGVRWTKKQVEKLKELYPICYKVEDLIGIFERSERSIYHKAHELGLKRNSNIGNENLVLYGEKNRFKKGQTPWNKNTKGICIGGKETQFKKGHIPKNTKHFGKPYLVERNNRAEKFWVIQELGSNKRLVYSRYLWEKEKGKIPKGHLVYYLNGVNEMTPPTIKDFGLISRSENMDRNTIHRYSPELKKSIRLVKKLKKEVNEAS